MRKLFQSFKTDESGATLVEYGVALIIAIVVGGTTLIALSGEVGTNMGDACGAMNGVDQIADTCAE
mgnify:CR=1 FL=1